MNYYNYVMAACFVIVVIAVVYGPVWFRNRYARHKKGTEETSPATEAHTAEPGNTAITADAPQSGVLTPEAMTYIQEQAANRAGQAVLRPDRNRGPN